MPTSMCICQNRQENTFPGGLSLSIVDASVLGNAMNDIKGISKTLLRSKWVQYSALGEKSSQPKTH